MELTRPRTRMYATLGVHIVLRQLPRDWNTCGRTHSIHTNNVEEHTTSTNNVEEHISSTLDQFRLHIPYYGPDRGQTINNPGSYPTLSYYNLAHTRPTTTWLVPGQSVNTEENLSSTIIITRGSNVAK
jgi:hypothetical protein